MIAITSPSKRCKGGSIANGQIDSSIQLKCLKREGTVNQDSDDQVGSYKCPDCILINGMCRISWRELGLVTLAKSFQMVPLQWTSMINILMILIRMTRLTTTSQA
ncbi:hypothetical protein Fot_20069 [Forsythia ovata]|uniref:Uncharacterized protein n=1 Tax=Forsythia ovata TaxID=205694 RepID=A0ABD1VMY6_9LAMI